MRTIVIAAALCGLVLGCGSSASPPPEYPPDPNASQDETTVTVERVQEEPEPTPPPPEPPPPPPVQLVAAENTPIEGANPTIRITSPRDNARIARGDVMLTVALANWTLGADPGNHVHVIVDNEPYMAVRDVSQPLNLNALVRTNLQHELAPGSHVVRVFPSRPQHESVKAGSPFAVVRFVYQTPTAGFTFDPRAPLLTYSRPKGCYTTGARVLLDFYVTNTALAADGTRVHWSVDELSGDITTWAPHYLENLPAGSHTIHLTLTGADGAPIAGPFNDTTRTITVADSCAPPAAPGAPAAAAPPADPHADHGQH